MQGYAAKSRVIRLFVLGATVLVATPSLAGETKTTTVTWSHGATEITLGYYIWQCPNQLWDECNAWGTSQSTCTYGNDGPATLTGSADINTNSYCVEGGTRPICTYLVSCSQTCQVTCADNPTPPPNLNDCDFTDLSSCNGICPGWYNNNGNCYLLESIAPNCWMCGCDINAPACECTDSCMPEEESHPEETPILIDLDRGGVRLTPPEDGVLFDIDASGVVELVAWTEPGAGEGWLVLDRNRNGTIDHGGELFGNSTALVSGALAPQGFAALADLDSAAMMGNGDGVLDYLDGRFEELRVWIDANHNGLAEDGELVAFDEAGILSIDLGYVENQRQDPHGNLFRYRGTAWALRGSAILPLHLHDVILVVQ